MPILADIRKAKHGGGLRHTAKALRRSLEKGITSGQIKEALNSADATLLGENIEHPNQASPACLILGWDETNRAIHTVVAYVRMLVVTVYEPMPPKWDTPWEKGKS